ncbi:uncharacterized protein LOC114527163 [Dendronephthya gigantea]|uniref:uncharacterized protein LOC114527163 n=1 Tax=Dendronephthya gigantea TaxID=151771 RepID=UPI001069D2FB|nr:uncharacterized protein LOC114527163 [Dendronephthya gigantea]
MFSDEYKYVYLLLFLLFTVRARANNTSTSETYQSSATKFQMTSTQPIMSKTYSQIQSSSPSVSSKRITSSQSITQSNSQTTQGISNNDEDKIEPWVIVVISASAAVVLVVIFILSLLFICRRRRIQRLERERNLSYTNANYESTVKFRADMAELDDGTTLESDPCPQSANNNPRRDAGYECVELPNEKRPQYENVSPQHHPKMDNASSPNPQYENVTPMVSSGNDKANAPVGPYEEVLLDSPLETNGNKKNKKHYENIELKI